MENVKNWLVVSQVCGHVYIGENGMFKILPYMELAAKKRWDGVIMTLLMKVSHGPVFQLINKYKGLGKFISIILGLYVGKQHMPYNHTDESMEEKLKIVKGRFDINIDINFSEVMLGLGTYMVKTGLIVFST